MEKSTLARLYVSNHPLTLALDIDRVRAMLGGWLERPGEAGAAARRLALAMADVHLSASYDMVVPQYLGRVDFVLDLKALAIQAGAQFVEIALVSDPVDTVGRFARRSEWPENDEHQDAAMLQDQNGELTGMTLMYERLLQVTASRPGTHSVVTVDGEVDATYRQMLEQIRGDDNRSGDNPGEGTVASEVTPG